MFPNLKAEMARNSLSYTDIAIGLDKPKSWVENRLSGRAVLPVEYSFIIQEKFFPSLDIKYLFDCREK